MSDYSQNYHDRTFHETPDPFLMPSETIYSYPNANLTSTFEGNELLLSNNIPVRIIFDGEICEVDLIQLQGTDCLFFSTTSGHYYELKPNTEDQYSVFPMKAGEV